MVSGNEYDIDTQNRKSSRLKPVNQPITYNFMVIFTPNWTKTDKMDIRAYSMILHIMHFLLALFFRPASSIYQWSILGI